MKIPVIIISEDKGVAELVKRYSEKTEKYTFIASTFDFSKAYNAVKELSKVLVVVDISEYQEQVLNFVSKVTSDFPQCRVSRKMEKPGGGFLQNPTTRINTE